MTLIFVRMGNNAHSSQGIENLKVKG